jgi:hypothetical protein
MVCLALALPRAEATLYTLNDLNSTVQIDPQSQGGMSLWTVDNKSQMRQQWFWYRIGSTGPESSIETLGTPSVWAIDNPFNVGVDSLYVQYVGASFTLQLKFILTGAAVGTKQSDIMETVSIINTSGSGLQLHFFQYTDFDLAGTENDDTARILGGNTALQTDSGPTAVSETVVSPRPSHYEVALYSQTRDSLTDGAATTLNDKAGSVYGDVTWAFQWDFVMPASGDGSTMIISKDLRITHTPEPLTVLGVVMGLGSVGAYFVRRRKL